MADQKCPNCGKDLPSELGQHAVTPVSGLVTCPHCGAEVRLEKASAGTEGREGASDFTGAESTESFSGHETAEGVRKELEEKQARGGLDRTAEETE
jgi:endogenous inhibitor of DNA gyrase (YacG/DUF329 family)